MTTLNVTMEREKWEISSSSVARVDRLLILITSHAIVASTKVHQFNFTFYKNWIQPPSDHETTKLWEEKMISCNAIAIIRDMFAVVCERSQSTCASWERWKSEKVIRSKKRWLVFFVLDRSELSWTSWTGRRSRNFHRIATKRDYNIFIHIVQVCGIRLCWWRRCKMFHSQELSSSVSWQIDSRSHPPTSPCIFHRSTRCSFLHNFAISLMRKA